MNEDWYQNGHNLMIDYISEKAVLSIAQVRDAYAVMRRLGLIDYDIEKDVILEYFCDEGEEDE
jgi:hypothetical protein